LFAKAMEKGKIKTTRQRRVRFDFEAPHRNNTDRSEALIP